MTLVVGLIGDPVAHSRSPALHNAAFAWCGIDAHYELWPTTADALPERVAALRAPGMLGANVTLPHKLAVMPLLDRLDPLAEMVGAVNTIIREADGTLTGANTDAPAVLATVREDAGYDPAGQTVIILGASGAARAAAAVLLPYTARLVVVNRTLARAEDLLGDLLATSDADPVLFAVTPDDAELPLLFSEASLIINATSLGWHGEALPLDAALIPAKALVFDMVYKPTPLLRAATARGARTLDGMGMLVRQAALAFERWTGTPAPLDVLRDAFMSK